MIKACEKILACIERLDREAFEADWLRFGAVLRNLKIFGEGAKCVSEWGRRQHPNIPWRKIAAMRDIVSHHYFGLDLDAIWDAVKNRAPSLLEGLRRIKNHAASPT